MAPPTVQNVALAGALLYAVVILIASAASKDLLFPMSPTGSAADLAIVSGLLAVISLVNSRPGGDAAAAAAAAAAATTGVAAETREHVVLGSALITVTLACTKSAMISWGKLDGRSTLASLLTLVVEAVLFAAAGLFTRREGQRRRLASQQSLARDGKSLKLLEEAGGGGGGGRGAYGEVSP